MNILHWWILSISKRFFIFFIGIISPYYIHNEKCHYLFICVTLCLSNFMPECSKGMTFVNIVNNRDFNVFIFEWEKIITIFCWKNRNPPNKVVIWNLKSLWFLMFCWLIGSEYMWFWYDLPHSLAHPIWLKKSWFYSWCLYRFRLYEFIVYYCALLLIRSIWSYSRSHLWFGYVGFIVWPQLTENKISNQYIGCYLLASGHSVVSYDEDIYALACTVVFQYWT